MVEMRSVLKRKTMFIYKITNIHNNKCYIGQTIRPIAKRIKRHFNDAIHNVLDTHLARAIRHYGVESFIYEQIDTATTQEELNLKEQYYIRLFDSIQHGYNETDALYKCGGNTYKEKSSKELQEIANKVRKSKIGSKNPNHRAIKALNVDTQIELHFATMKECQEFFHEKHHRFITTRVLGQTQTLYKKVWNLAYEECDYRPLAKDKTQNKCRICVINQETKQVLNFTSINSMCKTLKISRNKIKMGEDTFVKPFMIYFT